MRRAAATLVSIVIVTVAAAGVWFLAVRPAADLRWAQTHTLAATGINEPAALTARWYGTTAVLLQAGDEAIFIDPFFTRPEGVWPMLRNAQIAPDEKRIAVWLARVGVTALRGVLVSHSHFDHAMDAGVVARQTGALLVGSQSTANIGLGAGLPAERIIVATDTGSLAQPITLGAFRVRFLAGAHAGATGGAPTGDIVKPLVPPASYADYRQGGTYSIVVEHGADTVLFHGSAGHVDDALKDVHADVVFLGAALVSKPAEYLQQVVDAVGAKQVVLTHWDDFTRSLDQPLRPMPVVVNLATFGEVLAVRTDLNAGVAPLGQAIRLSANDPLP
ncbi:MAG: MBL fold metallo-hydrolase [Pseudomonadota bacterium]|nr:MBL fold metallo-hydrolase [Pseudomonadota bacterium]